MEQVSQSISDCVTKDLSWVINKQWNIAQSSGGWEVHDEGASRFRVW
jgi:hypothetical protein